MIKFFSKSYLDCSGIAGGCAGLRVVWATVLPHALEDKYLTMVCVNGRMNFSPFFCVIDCSRLEFDEVCYCDFVNRFCRKVKLRSNRRSTIGTASVQIRIF